MVISTGFLYEIICRDKYTFIEKKGSQDGSNGESFHCLVGGVPKYNPSGSAILENEATRTHKELRSSKDMGMLWHY